ncbi:MAG: lysostaphin resistance A-like protein [Hyphomicrobiaceae bacterium]
MPLRQLLIGPPRYIAATPWRGRWAIASTIAIFIVGQLVAAAVVSAAARFGLVSEEMPGPLMLWLVVSQAAMVALVLLAAGLFGGRRLEVLQLRPVAQGSWLIGAAILAMALLLGGLNALLYWLFENDMMADLRPHRALIQSDAWPLAALAIGVGAPLMEELTFRGFLQSALAQRLGFWPAALITTAAWTLLHWGYSAAGMAEVFLIGLYFSWLLWKTGSLLPALICHAVYNTSLVFVLRFAPLPV